MAVDQKIKNDNLLSMSICGMGAVDEYKASGHATT